MQKILTRKSTGRTRVQTINDGKPDPGVPPTQQQYKDECDINNIMKKYNTTGQFTHLTGRQGVYADFTQITDYKDMLEAVRYADEAFASLPAEMRLRFKNDPAEILSFLQDEKNYDEGVKLGLLTERPQKFSATIPNDDSNNDKKSGSQKTGKTKTESQPSTPPKEE